MLYNGFLNIARAKGVSAYPADGSNRWPAVHRLDAAHLFRLALESAPTGSRLHAVGDEGVLVRDIVGVIGHRLGVPVVSLPVEEVGSHFGFLGPIFSLDCPASSALTQLRLGGVLCNRLCWRISTRITTFRWLCKMFEQ